MSDTPLDQKERNDDVGNDVALLLFLVAVGVSAFGSGIGIGVSGVQLFFFKAPSTRSCSTKEEDTSSWPFLTSKSGFPMTQHRNIHPLF